jgi:hypothetical protein
MTLYSVFCFLFFLYFVCKLQKRCTRLAAASDKVYQLLAHGRWFSPGTLASSTTKTGRHDIAEILHANHYTTDAVSRYDDHTTELYNIGLGLLCLTPLSLSVLFVEEN